MFVVLVVFNARGATGARGANGFDAPLVFLASLAFFIGKGKVIIRGGLSRSLRVEIGAAGRGFAVPCRRAVVRIVGERSVESLRIVELER